MSNIQGSKIDLTKSDSVLAERLRAVSEDRLQGENLVVMLKNTLGRRYADPTYGRKMQAFQQMFFQPFADNRYNSVAQMEDATALHTLAPYSKNIAQIMLAEDGLEAHERVSAEQALENIDAVVGRINTSLNDRITADVRSGHPIMSGTLGHGVSATHALKL